MQLMSKLKQVLALGLALTMLVGQVHADPKPRSTEDDLDPVIVLPKPPPTDGDGPAPKPKPPVPSPSNPQTPDMKPIDKSAFPNMTCPLVDQRPYKNILDAIQALEKVVVITPNCQNNADLVKLSEEAKKMVTSAASLKGLFENPEALTSEQVKIGDFQANLNNVLTGINKFSEVLQNNAFLNSKCGEQLKTTGGVVLALSDLVSSFAPFALLGASMNPSIGAALPYVLGITGVSSVAKIIKSVSDERTTRMSKPELRQALLVNVCEYSKISQRVRFLKLAQSGQLDQVNKEIQSMSKATYDSLQERFSKRVFTMRDTHIQYSTILKNAQHQMKSDKTEIAEIKGLLGNQPDEILQCGLAREIVLKARESNDFPAKAITNFQKLLSLQSRITAPQSSVLKTEAWLRNQLLAKIEDNSEQGLKECNKLSKSYLEALSRLVERTEPTITRLQESLETEMTKDPEYAQFRRTELSVNREVRMLNQVSTILKNVSTSNASIDKVEMDAELNNLRRALFSRPAGLPVMSGSSPALAWLNFVSGEFYRSVNEFENDLSSLIQDTYSATRSGRQEMFKIDEKGQTVRDATGRPVPMTPQELVEQSRRDWDGSQNLTILSNKMAPVGTEAHRRLCLRLENIWLNWAATQDQLEAQEFFCQNIQSFFNSTTESGLTARCLDRMTINGRVLRSSEIELARQSLVSKGYEKKAYTISRKLKELACEMPDASVMN